jgi:hypothetical protein
MRGITNIIVLFRAWKFACESYLGTVMFRYHDVTLSETALSQLLKFQSTLNYAIMQSSSLKEFLEHVSVLGADFVRQ